MFDKIRQEINLHIDKHGYWATMPGHPVEDWRLEVSDGYTREGYHDWIYNRMSDTDEVDRLREALEALTADASNAATDSYCEWCKAHAPKDTLGNLTGPIIHHTACSYVMAHNALGGEE